MNSNRWREVSRIYGAVLTKPESDRATALASLCRDDAELRAEVESLLQSGQDVAVLNRAATESPSTLGLLDGQPIGSTIGVFRIDSLLGVGGMGEVYRARDTKLNRDVAIKILPPAFASDPDRLARFKREAQMLASLNHPNIGGIYGFEDAGAVHALVLELVEGATLADRIARGPLPVDETLAIARQVADALEAAHEQGIIHRDLKPANIKVREDGTVKVLDFGLAKMTEVASQSQIASVTQSPTITTPAMTAAGMILGTAAYMSPEQAKGKAADKRSDIWAFGCVLYEMLTGTRAFQGTDVADTLAAVLRGQPDWTRLPAALTPSVLRLLRRSLEKNRHARLADVADARLELNDSSAADIVSARTYSWRVAIAVLILGLAVGGLLARAYLKAPPPATAPVVRFSILPPESGQFSPTPGGGAGITAPPLAASPDGRWIVFGALTADRAPMLWLRAIDSLDTRALEGTEGARYAFWSPDSRFIAFMTQGQLKVIAVGGGSAHVLMDLDNGAGGSWSQDGTIVLSLAFGGLFRTSADGAPLTPLALDNEIGKRARFPVFFPDGRHFMFWVRDGGGAMYSGALDSPRVAKITDASRAAQWVPGYLAFVRGRSLFIQPFDEVSVRLSGVPIPVADLVVSTQSGYAAFSLSRNGVLAYSKGERQYQQLVWKDRSGAELGRLGQPALQGNVRLVEDGGKVLVTRTDPETFAPTTWLYDAVRNGASKIADGTSAVASRDAVWLAFRQNPSSSGEASIARLRLRGGDTPEKLASIAGWATDFSPDGRYLLTMSPEPNNQLDVLLVEIRTGKVTPFIASPAGEGAAKFSPDQKWVAYVSDHTGRGEVFVRSMSDDGERRIPVSTEGASQPQWSDDGRELFYVARTGVLTAVDASTVGGHFVAGRPHPMFPIHSRIASMVANSFFGPDYAVSRDGRRFLVVETVSSETGLTVLINWPQMVQQDEAHDR